MGNTQKKEISILIPTYNCICTELVKCLQHQSEAIAEAEQGNFIYEILVGDDGSDNIRSVKENEKINDISKCHFIHNEQNRGAAATRNMLAKSAKCKFLLFIDSDSKIVHNNFISTFLKHYDMSPVIYGGISIPDHEPSKNVRLRYRYELNAQKRFSVERRQARPYSNFRTSCFMIRRDVMLSTPFDDRIKRSGYEDLLFGSQLYKREIPILHIDNDIEISGFENNEAFVRKTEQSLQTLYEFRKELSRYSALIMCYDKLSKYHLDTPLLFFHKLFHRCEYNNLTSCRPSMSIFALYKLGYYISLTKNNNNEEICI